MINMYEERRTKVMAFFSSAISTLSTLVVAIGAGLGVWGRRRYHVAWNFPDSTAFLTVLEEDKNY